MPTFQSLTGVSFVVYLLLVLASASNVSAETRSVADIEAALDPLEFIANHGGVRRAIDLDIRFHYDSAELLPEGLDQLQALGGALQGERLSGYRFRIVGHTDGVGDADYNLRLSQRRANTVAEHLEQVYSLAGERLLAEGRGAAELLPNLDPTAAAHRRVQIIAEPMEGTADADTTGDTAPTQRDIPITW